MTSVLNATLSHPTIRPKNLGILPGRKSWLLNLDVIVFSDAGNIFDAIFMAARAALWDTKVPRTKSVQYRAKKGDRSDATQAMDMDVDETAHVGSALDTRQTIQVTDFELPDYWDEGEPLDGRQTWPVCLTLNLVCCSELKFTWLTSEQLPTLHFLDATLQEEASVPLKLLVFYSFPLDATPMLRGMRLLGTGVSDLVQVKSLLKVSIQHVFLSPQSNPRRMGRNMLGTCGSLLKESSRMKTLDATKKPERDFLIDKLAIIWHSHNGPRQSGK
jgi:exosome complex component RRP42